MNFHSHLRRHRRHLANVYRRRNVRGHSPTFVQFTQQLVIPVVLCLRFTTNANRRLRHLPPTAADVHDMLFELLILPTASLELRNCSFATSCACVTLLYILLPFRRHFIAPSNGVNHRDCTHGNKFSKCFVTRGSHSANTPSPSKLSRFNISSPRHGRHQFDGASSVLLP